jgi:hypothetical protein
MKKDMWCAFKSIGAVKIKQPKELALDRLLSTSSNENFLAFLQHISLPVNHQTVKLFGSYIVIIYWNNFTAEIAEHAENTI